MQLHGDLGQLTYCLNIHQTQTWPEVRAALSGPAARIAQSLSPDGDFAIGLRFSRQALDDLAAPGARAELAAILRDNRLAPVTVNGFPYGPFHGATVKEQVYQPDWRDGERLRYTNDLADLMAGLSAPGDFVSLSTVPGTFKPLARGHEAKIAGMLLRSVSHLVDVHRRTGVRVALAIEPEPFCFLETVAEAVAFFGSHLFCGDAAVQLAALTGLDPAAAAAALPAHLGLCYDVCHAAVEFEDAAASIAALRAAGIPVHKLQLSSALRIAAMDARMRDRLRAFAEPTYLHQVVRRTAGGLRRHADLPEALALGAATNGEEWRVHFHVPVFLKDLGAFSSTRGFLENILDLHRVDPISPHLEVETYTWDVLPDTLRGASVESDIARELGWVKQRLCG